MNPDTPIAVTGSGDAGAVMFSLLTMLAIGALVWRFSRSWKTTKTRHQDAMRVIRAHPTTGARDYPVCLIHGQRVVKKGDPCAVCLFDLESDIDEWERQK